MGCFRGLLILVLLVIGLAVAGSMMKSSPPEPAVAAATIDKSDQMQADRKALIEKLMREGIFQKVEVPGDLPRLWVKPGFYGLDFAMKEKFVSVVYAYYFDGSDETDTVRIFDSRTGNEVGSYAAVQGGLKLN